MGGAAFTFGYFYKRSRPMRQFMDRTMLKFPIIGPILYKSAIARFARTLATMFAAGVPLVEALESVAGATGNIVFENAVLKMRDEVATGQRLQRAMENTGLFPNMVIQMIAVGEEAGALDSMSSKVATFYEAEVDNAVDSMSALLEPLIMAILGILVGGLVVAMYLPDLQARRRGVTRQVPQSTNAAPISFGLARRFFFGRHDGAHPDTRGISCALHRHLRRVRPAGRQLSQRGDPPATRDDGERPARRMRDAGDRRKSSGD